MIKLLHIFLVGKFSLEFEEDTLHLIFIPVILTLNYFLFQSNTPLLSAGCASTTLILTDKNVKGKKSSRETDPMGKLFPVCGGVKVLTKS